VRLPCKQELAGSNPVTGSMRYIKADRVNVRRRRTDTNWIGADPREEYTEVTLELVMDDISERVRPYDILMADFGSGSLIMTIQEYASTYDNWTGGERWSFRGYGFTVPKNWEPVDIKELAAVAK
jgi:hypothetical protein